MVGYGSDGLYWGHGKPDFRHEHSGPNSCWNWDVQKVLSKRCTAEVNEYLASPRKEADEDQMYKCFVTNASASHKVCVRELKSFGEGKSSMEALKRCARKEFGLAIRNLVQTSIAVGECRPIA
jgi:hypothetical protein